jgi:hypothetical protein
MSAAQRKCLGDGVLIYFVKIAIVWRLITRLAQLFCQTRGGEGVTALPGRPQCECLSRRPFKTYPTDADSVRLGRPAERSGFFFLECRCGAAVSPEVCHEGRLLCAAADASSLPYVHSVSRCASKRLPSPGSALAGAFFWRRRSCRGERRPSVPLTQINATHALLRKIQVGQTPGRGGRKRTERCRSWPLAGSLPEPGGPHLAPMQLWRLKNG